MKRFLLIIAGLVITGSIINNVVTQYLTLKDAEWQNLERKQTIEKITEENKILEQKIEYATSSAFVDEEVHDKLGLGKANDAWISLGPEENLDLSPKVNEILEIPPIKQWIKLFTQ
jgi:hypothetical protein